MTRTESIKTYKKLKSEGGKVFTRIYNKAYLKVEEIILDEIKLGNYYLNSSENHSNRFYNLINSQKSEIIKVVLWHICRDVFEVID